LPGPAEVVLEDGTALRVPADLPPDLPLGYHTWRLLAGGPPGQLIASPGRCYLPEAWRTWGWAVQVYALWSSASWGIGDLADLRRLGTWSAGELGAGFLLLSPLGAAAPLPPQQPSPYSPSSRRFLSPLYLRVEEAPGAAEAGLDLEPLAAAGRALAGRAPIDRDAVLRLKLDALEALYSRFGGSTAFDGHRAREGPALDRFATYCVLAERHGANWRQWPEEYRHPGSGAVTRVSRESGRVRFHAWLQWLLADQLAGAAAGIRLLHDLPIGVEPDGADAWAWHQAHPDGYSA
jgi:4-alpha-glucanotransferase